ncbi:hypothetical protein R1sor_021765 [Riccia sorocarpa]|uniref:Uncharacterized protein n=1 Tax=Riccia sorocarpa TaxID=122646 RepID=A0ABD3GK42_9MARC
MEKEDNLDNPLAKENIAPAESPVSKTSTSKGNLNKITSKEVSQAIAVIPLISQDLNCANKLGIWADVEYEYMADSGPRGVKGRPAKGDSQTHERGNATKKRHTSLRGSSDQPDTILENQRKSIPSASSINLGVGGSEMEIGVVQDKAILQRTCQATQQSRARSYLTKGSRRKKTFPPNECTEDELTSLQTLEDQLDEVENQQASLWFLRSRSKWLREGEAPSHYLFSLVQARYSEDRICALQQANGDVVI